MKTTSTGSQRDPKGLDQHVILVGLPGAGKTTVGRAVATAMGWPFIDLDEEIERRTGERIGDIFATRGETAFRQLERDVTAQVARQPPSIISPGGGWIMQAETVALLRPVGCIIYLKVTPETALSRLGESYQTRPLLQADPQAAMQRLYATRRTAYEAADHVVEAEALTLQAVTSAVVELAGQTRIR